MNLDLSKLTAEDVKAIFDKHAPDPEKVREALQQIQELTKQNLTAAQTATVIVGIAQTLLKLA